MRQAPEQLGHACAHAGSSAAAGAAADDDDRSRRRSSSGRDGDRHERKRRSSHGDGSDGEGGSQQRQHKRPHLDDAARVDALRHALAIGFANRWGCAGWQPACADHMALAWLASCQQLLPCDDVMPRSWSSLQSQSMAVLVHGPAVRVGWMHQGTACDRRGSTLPPPAQGQACRSAAPWAASW